MKIPKIFYADLENVHHAAFWLATFGILADVFGLWRDRLLAANFGASRSLDIYYAAFRVPDFLYTVLLLLTASTALIPVFIEKIAKDKRSAEDLLGSLLLFFGLVMFFLGLAAFFMMPYISRMILPGFDILDQEKVVNLSRILLFSPLFLGLSNIFSGLTQSARRFFAYGLSPVFYNVGIILGVTLFSKFWGLEGLAWGVAFGAFLHLFVQIPVVFNMKVLPRMRNIWNPDMKRIFQQSFPRTLGLQITQMASIIFTSIASTLSSGSIAIFNLASNLQYIPITIIGLSYSVAAFPMLASFSMEKSKANFESYFSVAFRHILFWAVPFSVLLLVLRAQIVRVILGSGLFGWNDTRLTAASLLLLSLAVVFQSIFFLLIRAFYAAGEVWRPVAINVISYAFGIGAAFWFLPNLIQGSGAFSAVVSQILRLSDLPDIRVIALSLGILIASLVNFLLLVLAFRAVFGWFPLKGARRAILEIFFSSFCGGAVAYFGLKILSGVFNLHTFLGVFLQGFFSGLAGLLIIAAVLWVLGNRELFEVYRSARGLFLEKEKSREDMVPAPEPEKLP